MHLLANLLVFMTTERAFGENKTSRADRVQRTMLERRDDEQKEHTPEER
jgi:hypothetical protein